jgi:hypothetical protein
MMIEAFGPIASANAKTVMLWSQLIFSALHDERGRLMRAHISRKVSASTSLPRRASVMVARVVSCPHPMPSSIALVEWGLSKGRRHEELRIDYQC